LKVLVERTLQAHYQLKKTTEKSRRNKWKEKKKIGEGISNNRYGFACAGLAVSKKAGKGLSAR
jgi:hypothetical protein